MVDRLRSFWCPFLERLGLGKEEGKVKGEREGLWGVEDTGREEHACSVGFFWLHCQVDEGHRA